MKICMVTSVPVNPPWDQGDKNLAYTLTRTLPEIQFKVMTEVNSAAPVGNNILAQPVFKISKPNIAHKSKVFISLPKICKDISAIHLIYRPYWLSSWLLRFSPALRHYPKIHTVPATADGRSLDPRLFFSERIVTISAYGQRTLSAQGIKNVQHIAPGIMVDEWQELETQQERCKEALGLSNHPVILFPGHYGRGQGAQMMMDALPRIMAHEPKVRMIFACRIRSEKDRHTSQVMQRDLLDAGLGEAVVFFDRVLDMKSLIAASDVIALPLETMRDKLDLPTTLLEGLAAGKPVVISDLAPMKEILTDPHDGSVLGGLITPPGDLESLIESIIALIKDDKLRKAIGKQGQATVRERFNAKTMAEKYKNLYQEIAR